MISFLDEKNISIQDDEHSTNSVLDLNNISRRRKITISSIDHDSEIGSIYGFDIPFARQFSETLNGNHKMYNKLKSCSV